MDYSKMTISEIAVVIMDNWGEGLFWGRSLS